MLEIIIGRVKALKSKLEKDIFEDYEYIRDIKKEHGVLTLSCKWAKKRIKKNHKHLAQAIYVLKLLEIEVKKFEAIEK